MWGCERCGGLQKRFVRAIRPACPAEKVDFFYGMVCVRIGLLDRNNWNSRGTSSTAKECSIGSPIGKLPFSIHRSDCIGISPKKRSTKIEFPFGSNLVFHRIPARFCFSTSHQSTSLGPYRGGRATQVGDQGKTHINSGKWFPKIREKQNYSTKIQSCLSCSSVATSYWDFLV